MSDIELKDLDKRHSDGESSSSSHESAHSDGQPANMSEVFGGSSFGVCELRQPPPQQAREEADGSQPAKLSNATNDESQVLFLVCKWRSKRANDNGLVFFFFLNVDLCLTCDHRYQCHQTTRAISFNKPFRPPATATMMRRLLRRAENPTLACEARRASRRPQRQPLQLRLTVNHRY